MKQELMGILCCPVSQRSLYPASTELLAELNLAIAGGKLQQVDGAIVQQPVSAALVTNDDHRLYRVDDGLPVLIEEESILLAVMREH